MVAVLVLGIVLLVLSAGGFFLGGQSRDDDVGVALSFLATLFLVSGTIALAVGASNGALGMPTDCSHLQEHSVYQLVRQETVDGQYFALLKEPDGTIRLYKLEQSLPEGVYFKVAKGKDRRLELVPFK